MLCKVVAMLMFALMFASVRWLGPHFPIGEIVFFRSVLGLPVIVVRRYLTGGLPCSRPGGSTAMRCARSRA